MTAPPTSESLFTIQDFGLSAYQDVWALQKALVPKRLNGEIPDTLVMGEHPAIITLGRGSHAENLLNPSIPVIEIERGGDVTYHGPGQLVVYPILMLPDGRRDLHRYLRDLEEVIILTLASFGVVGIRNEGWTGVWVEAPPSILANSKSLSSNQVNLSSIEPTGRLLKIASIGVAVRKWVTYHGIALNVSTELAHFQQINPCGLDSQVMTSLVTLRPEASPNMERVKTAFIQAFRQIFTEH